MEDQIQTWWLVSKYSKEPKPVEVVKETEKSIVYKYSCMGKSNLRAARKVNSYEQYFKHLEDAQKCIDDRNQKESDQIKKMQLRDAAPDLLEALQELCDMLGKSPMTRKARAAIKKAIGEQQ